MFTGLIQDLGEISSIETITEGRRIRVRSRALFKELSVNDSVAVNGCCQTVIALDEESGEFVFESVHTTLNKTNFLTLSPGDLVNLELSLRASDRLGGHYVSGHVNGVGILLERKEVGENVLLTIQVPPPLFTPLVKEGSVAVDGVSLTISDLFDESHSFQVSIIPHTWKKTNLFCRQVGAALNIEVDMLVKYLEKLIAPYLNKLFEEKND